MLQQKILYLQITRQKILYLQITRQKRRISNCLQQNGTICSFWQQNYRNMTAEFFANVSTMLIQHSVEGSMLALNGLRLC